MLLIIEYRKMISFETYDDISTLTRYCS